MPTPSLAHSALELATLFHLTERRIQQLAKDKIIPKAKRGKYDLMAAIRGYVKYLQERAAGRAEGTYNDTTDIKTERKRLIKAQADKTECENQKLRGELVSFALVQDVLCETAVLYASSIDALPGRLANELAGLNDPAEIKARLFDECRRVRIATAKNLDRFADHIERGEISSNNSQCTEDEDTGSMGGQSPPPTTW